MNNSLPTRFPRGVERLLVERVNDRLIFLTSDRQEQVLLWPLTLCNLAQNLGNFHGYKFKEIYGVECRVSPREGSILFSEMNYEFHSLRNGETYILGQGDELIIYPPCWLKS